MDTRRTLGAFALAAAGFGLGAAMDGRPQQESVPMSMCVSPVIFPTAENYKILEERAGALYDAAFGTADEISDKTIVSLTRETLAEGKTITFTGIDPDGASSTLPDGTTRATPCLNYRIGG